MKYSKVIYIFFTFLIISLLINYNVIAQDSVQLVRLAKLEINADDLENYKAFLKEEIEASLKLEKGVLTLYAVFEIKKPNFLTILEIYANKKAYEKHILTPHFKKYKEGTKTMVKNLELVDAIPLIANMKLKYSTEK